jgi:hypothetical protein
MSLISKIVREIIAEANVQKMGRRKLIRARVRTIKGKPTIQRRKVFSSVKGYTIRGGKLIRMTQAERLRRRLSQRRAKFKRRAKLARALIKRKRSMQRRKGLGLR